MASGDVVTVSLRRFDTSQPWGFKLQGGTEYGLPLFIAQVSPKSIAGTAGLQNGDGIVRIGDACANGWSHEKAKAELIRAGNDVDLTVKRGAVNTADPAVRAAGQQAASPRVELDEGSINPHMNEGSAYRDVKPKTYQILEQQLSGSTPAPSALGRGKGRQAGGGGGGAGPSSIFDRKKQERSGYLQAQGKTIQKAYVTWFDPEVGSQGPRYQRHHRYPQDPRPRDYRPGTKRRHRGCRPHRQHLLPPRMTTIPAATRRTAVARHRSGGDANEWWIQAEILRSLLLKKENGRLKTNISQIEDIHSNDNIYISGSNIYSNSNINRFSDSDGSNGSDISGFSHTGVPDGAIYTQLIQSSVINTSTKSMLESLVVKLLTCHTTRYPCFEPNCVPRPVIGGVILDRHNTPPTRSPTFCPVKIQARIGLQQPMPVERGNRWCHNEGPGHMHQEMVAKVTSPTRQLQLPSIVYSYKPQPQPPPPASIGLTVNSQAVKE